MGTGWCGQQAPRRLGTPSRVGRAGEEGRKVPDDRAELNRDALRRALAHSESFTCAELLRAFGPLSIDAERTAALTAETDETSEHQRAALAMLFALTGLYGYGITHDFEIATRAWTDAHGGLSFAGAQIIDELVERADSIAERFGLKPCTVPHPASEFDDPGRFRECVNAIRSWATDMLREPAARSIGEPHRQYVTLEQIAAIINRSKRTLEKWKVRKLNQLPRPDIEGGGGKPDEWDWESIRPWLEQASDRSLPNKYPSDRLRRG